MIKLKPCPVCGDAWIYVSKNDYCSGYEAYGYSVNCKCGFNPKRYGWHNTKGMAIVAWNEAVEI